MPVHNWTIYMYTFPDGKKYVGATKRPLHLRQGSKESGWSRYKNCKSLWPAIQKSGVDNIMQSILYQGEIEDSAAAYLETHFILKYGTFDSDFGYNRGLGGEGITQRHLSEQRRDVLANQMRQIAIGNAGRKTSDETRKRQRDARLGRHFSPLTEAHRKKIGEAIHLTNQNPESQKRRSDSKKQPVEAVRVSDGNRLCFESGEAAADYFGVQASAVSRWIAGERKPRNGYRFYKISEVTV